jgi:hypothetical protein
LRLIAICDGYRAMGMALSAGSRQHASEGDRHLLDASKLPGSANVSEAPYEPQNRPRPRPWVDPLGALERRCLYPDGPLLFALPAGKLADHPE